MARQHERDEARRTLWQERLEPARAPDLPAEKRLRRVAQALASKGWKIEVKDLTPELRDFADDYLAVCGMPNVVRPSELWLVDADRWVRALKNQWSQTFYGEGSKYDAFFFGFRLFDHPVCVCQCLNYAPRAHAASCIDSCQPGFKLCCRFGPIHSNDTPSYDDPSRFGGGALPIH